MHHFLQQGYGTVARKTRIEYKQPALLGDKLEITTHLSDVRSVRATRHFIIRRQSDQALIAQAFVIWVFIDLNTGQPVRMPPELRKELAAHIAD
jgi:acyl-CoA thioester hydrolase